MVYVIAHLSFTQAIALVKSVCGLHAVGIHVADGHRRHFACQSPAQEGDLRMPVFGARVPADSQFRRTAITDTEAISLLVGSSLGAIPDGEAARFGALRLTALNPGAAQPPVLMAKRSCRPGRPHVCADAVFVCSEVFSKQAGELFR